MSKEELKKNQFPNDEFLQSAVSQIVDKCTAELEQKISVLLSCKNCPENKGGLLCQKEYEDKCLAQKIQYIKELKEENAELKEINTYTLSQLNLDNGELIIELTKAKEIIRDFISVAIDYIDKEDKNYSYIVEAEQFLKGDK